MATGGTIDRKGGTIGPSGLSRVRIFLRRLYRGRTPRAITFQIAVILIDLAIIAFFIVTPLIAQDDAFLWLDYGIAAVLAADIIARTLASANMGWWLRQPTVLVDLFILVTLLAPDTLANLGFLRILRLWSVARSELIWRTLLQGRATAWRELVQAASSLLTFLFLMTGLVYTAFLGRAPGIDSYIDALYFTVATVTTTGFGDVTLPGPWGKITSIIAMLVGISLFVRLAQAVFRPYKVNFACPRCALQRHEPDAVHCKACGEVLCIPDSED